LIHFYKREEENQTVVQYIIVNCNIAT